MKTALTSTPVLGFPREEGQWYLDTDTSDVGTAAVLSQIQGGEERVIGYLSKSLEGSKQCYCMARKKLLTVVRALKNFKCCLYGQKITVGTDNSDVSWLHRSKDPLGQPDRWIDVFDTYDITVPGDQSSDEKRRLRAGVVARGDGHATPRAPGAPFQNRSRTPKPGDW